MKAKRRSTPSRSCKLATQRWHPIFAHQSSSRSPAKPKKKKKQRPPQPAMPGDDALIRRDAQRFRDFAAHMQSDFERAMHTTRPARRTTSSSPTQPPDASAQTGVFYDDEAFWVVYQGRLIATVGSASEGYDVLQRYGMEHGGTNTRKKT